MHGGLSRDVSIALAAIGWADGTLDPKEADAIVRAAVDERLELEAIHEIEVATQKPVSTSAIDLDHLAEPDRLIVYAVGSWSVGMDGRLAPEERTALDALGNRLRIPAGPRLEAEAIAYKFGQLGASDEPLFYDLPKRRASLKSALDEARRRRLATRPGLD